MLAIAIQMFDQTERVIQEGFEVSVLVLWTSYATLIAFVQQNHDFENAKCNSR